MCEFSSAAPLPPDAHAEPLGGGVRIWVSPRFSFGMDAVLLAHFALDCSPRAAFAADLGTGCGILPMLWARERPQLHILAAEIQPEGAALAARSAAEQGFAARIRVRVGDFLTLTLPEVCRIYAETTAANSCAPAGGLDFIACNPPYFPSGSGAKSGCAQRLLARSEECCTFAETAQTAARLLRPGGWFCVIHRAERLCTVLAGLRAAGLEPKRLRMIQPDAQHAPKLFLAAGRRGGREGLELLPALLLRKADGQPGRELRQIYGETE